MTSTNQYFGSKPQVTHHDIVQTDLRGMGVEFRAGDPVYLCDGGKLVNWDYTFPKHNPRLASSVVLGQAGLSKTKWPDELDMAYKEGVSAQSLIGTSIQYTWKDPDVVRSLVVTSSVNATGQGYQGLSLHTISIPDLEGLGTLPYSYLALGNYQIEFIVYTGSDSNYHYWLLANGPTNVNVKILRMLKTTGVLTVSATTTVTVANFAMIVRLDLANQKLYFLDSTTSLDIPVLKSISYNNSAFVAPTWTTEASTLLNDWGWPGYVYGWNRNFDFVLCDTENDTSYYFKAATTMNVGYNAQRNNNNIHSHYSVYKLEWNANHWDVSLFKSDVKTSQDFHQDGAIYLGGGYWTIGTGYYNTVMTQDRLKYMYIDKDKGTVIDVLPAAGWSSGNNSQNLTDNLGGGGGLAKRDPSMATMMHGAGWSHHGGHAKVYGGYVDGKLYFHMDAFKNGRLAAGLDFYSLVATHENKKYGQLYSNDTWMLKVVPLVMHTDAEFVYGVLYWGELNTTTVRILGPWKMRKPIEIISDGPIGRALTDSSNGAKAINVLTLTSGNVTAGDTVTIGSKVYTFQTTLTDVDGNVLRGATSSVSLANLGDAVNKIGSANRYAASMTKHPDIEQISVINAGGTDNSMVFMAREFGTSANSIASTETGTNLAWTMGATFQGGKNRGEFTMELFDNGQQSDLSVEATDSSIVNAQKFKNSYFPSRLFRGTFDLDWVGCKTTRTVTISPFGIASPLNDDAYSYEFDQPVLNVSLSSYSTDDGLFDQSGADPRGRRVLVHPWHIAADKTRLEITLGVLP